MAQVRFCDKCGLPFPTTEIGSQQVQATTLGRNNQGRYESVTDQYDLCAADAIGAMPKREELKARASKVDEEAENVEAGG